MTKDIDVIISELQQATGLPGAEIINYIQSHRISFEETLTFANMYERLPTDQETLLIYNHGVNIFIL